MATWYKQRLKDSLLGKVYVNRNKTKGIDTQDKEINQKIYDQYIESFKKGVYNFIKEDVDPATQEIIPRKYFSGGMKWKLRLKTLGAFALGTLLGFGEPDVGNAQVLAAAAMRRNKDGATTEFVDNANPGDIGTAIVVKEGVQPILLAQASGVANDGRRLSGEAEHESLSAKPEDTIGEGAFLPVGEEGFNIVSPTETDSLGTESWKIYLNSRKLLEAWMPPSESPYLSYVKTVTISSVDSIGEKIQPRYSEGEKRSEEGIDNLIKSGILDEHTAIILDSGGAHSVAMAVRLMKIGYQPIVMFDSIPHPKGVNRSEQELATLLFFAEQTKALKSQRVFSLDSPPVFILDAHRDDLIMGGELKNTYHFSIEDFPSGEELRKFGITKAVYLNEGDQNGRIDALYQSSDRLGKDLKPIVKAWESGGIKMVYTGVSPWKDLGVFPWEDLSRPFSMEESLSYSDMEPEVYGEKDGIAMHKNRERFIFTARGTFEVINERSYARSMTAEEVSDFRKAIEEQMRKQPNNLDLKELYDKLTAGSPLEGKAQPASSPVEGEKESSGPLKNWDEIKQQFETLIDEATTQDELKRIYRKIAHTVHPDKVSAGDKEIAHRIFISLSDMLKSKLDSEFNVRRESTGAARQTGQSDDWLESWSYTAWSNADDAVKVLRRREELVKNRGEKNISLVTGLIANNIKNLSLKDLLNLLDITLKTEFAKKLLELTARGAIAPAAMTDEVVWQARPMLEKIYVVRTIRKGELVHFRKGSLIVRTVILEPISETNASLQMITPSESPYQMLNLTQEELIQPEFDLEREPSQTGYEMNIGDVFEVDLSDLEFATRKRTTATLYGVVWGQYTFVAHDVIHKNLENMGGHGFRMGTSYAADQLHTGKIRKITPSTLTLEQQSIEALEASENSPLQASSDKTSSSPVGEEAVQREIELLMKQGKSPYETSSRTSAIGRLPHVKGMNGGQAIDVAVYLKEIIFGDRDEDFKQAAEHALKTIRAKFSSSMEKQGQGSRSKEQEAASGEVRDAINETASSPVEGNRGQGIGDRVQKEILRDTSDEIRTTKKVGGIDLNPALLDLQIKRDGNGVPLPLPQQPIETMHIDGFLPVIINIVPITNLPFLLGLDLPSQEEKPVQLTYQELSLAVTLARERFHTRELDEVFI